MIDSWNRLLLRWLFLLMFMLAGTYFLLGWGDPPFNAARATFIAIFTSTAVVLPAVLSKATPVGSRRPGFTSTDESWFCYVVLLAAGIGAVIATAAPDGTWRVLGIGAAVAGGLLAGAIWTGRLPIARRR